MATTNEILARLEAVDIEVMVEDILQDLLEYLADLNRWQLSRGLNKDGDYLPRYIDDPYFDNPRQAYGYQKWKESISPNKQKPKEVMDFFINGYSYDHIQVKAQGKKLDIFADPLPWADEIDQKTQNKALGLSPDSVKESWNEEIHPRLVGRIRTKTGLL